MEAKLKILVTMKRVVNPELKLKINSDGKSLNFEGMNFVENYFDEIAVEEAVRIREKSSEAVEIIACSIGSDANSKELRKCLALGADRAILVKHDAEVDSDLVARVLQKVVEKETPDWIIMGKQATDDDNNMAGQMLAEYLSWPQACFASEVKIEGNQAMVTREVDGGLEVKNINSPAIITCDLRLNEPRLTPLPAIMKAKRKPLETIALADLDVDANLSSEVVAWEEPAGRSAGQMVESVDDLLDKLRNEAKAL